MAILVEEGGLEASWEKHAKAARRLWKALESRGFELFIARTEHRVPSVTSVFIPAGVDALQVSSFAMAKYKFEISGGLGPTAGRIFRIGLMGGNATDVLVDRTVDILGEAIRETRKSKL